MSLRFSQSYQPGMWTGEMLHVRCDVDAIEELRLKITGIREQNFKDADGPEWVLSFGPDEPEYRLRARQWQNARALAAEFGEDGNAWVGQEVILKPRFVRWKDRETNEEKSGWTIDIKPVPPPAGTVIKKAPDLDDEIPF